MLLKTIGLLHIARTQPPIRYCAASLATGSRRETLAERNERLRVASEAKLEESRSKLCALTRVLTPLCMLTRRAKSCVRRAEDAKRRADLGALRTVLHERSITVHAPPAALYTHSAAFRFPALTTTSPR